MTKPVKKFVHRTVEFRQYSTSGEVLGEGSHRGRWSRDKKGLRTITLPHELPTEGSSAVINCKDHYTRKDTIQQWIEAFQALKAEFSKPEYKNVHIHLDSESSYYDSRDYMWKVSFEELETDQEYVARLEAEAEAKRKKEMDRVVDMEKERLLYEKLKKKYEGKS